MNTTETPRQILRHAWQWCVWAAGASLVLAVWFGLPAKAYERGGLYQLFIEATATALVLLVAGPITWVFFIYLLYVRNRLARPLFCRAWMFTEWIAIAGFFWRMVGGATLEGDPPLLVALAFQAGKFLAALVIVVIATPLIWLLMLPVAAILERARRPRSSSVTQPPHNGRALQPSGAMEPTVKATADCSDAELRSFCRLVREGGQVNDAGLEGRVNQARQLVFLRDAAILAGTAAIKQPTDHYRTRVFRSASVAWMMHDYELELGYVVVAEAYRGRGLSRQLVEAVLHGFATTPLFATSRADRDRMHRTLRRLAFTQVGEPYESDEEGCNVLLFVRGAAQQRDEADKVRAG